MNSNIIGVILGTPAILMEIALKYHLTSMSILGQALNLVMVDRLYK